MYSPGHLGVGLLVSAVLIVKLDPRQSLWITVYILIGAWFPDIDTELPLAHHGVTHTLTGAVVGSVLIGFVFVGLAAGHRRLADQDSIPPGNSRTLFLVSSGALFLGGVSHIAMDLISAPVSSEPLPLHPLWPFRDSEATWLLIPINSDLWNYGLLLAGSIAFVLIYISVHQGSKRPHP